MSISKKVDARVILLRRLFIVVALTAIGAGLAYTFSHRQQPRKVATAMLVFGQPRPEMQIVANSFSTGDPGSQLVPPTDAALVSADDVARATSRKVGLSPQQVRSDVSVSAQQNSHIVQIQASRPNAAGAAQLANAYANAYVTRAANDQRQRALKVRKALQTQLSQIRQSTTTRTSTLTGSTNSTSASADSLRAAMAAETALAQTGSGSPSIAQTASPTDTSTSPKTTRNTLFGGLFGLLLGIGIAGLAGGSRREPPYEDDPRAGGVHNGDRRRTPVGV
jgi:uncharacterized protein involved in exopolysaccharide biosynthesis